MVSFRYWGVKFLSPKKTPQNVKKQGRSWFKLGGGTWGGGDAQKPFYYFFLFFNLIFVFIFYLP
jgi:hypothetical protein